MIKWKWLCWCMLYNKFHYVNLWFNHSFLCLALDSWLLVRVVLVFGHVRKIVTVSFVIFVCPSVLYPFLWNSLPSTGWLFLKFDILVFFENLLTQFKFHYKLARIMGTLQEDQYTFWIISLLVLLRMRKFSDGIIVKIKTQILCSILFFKNCSINEIMWKNILEPDRPQRTI